jgi:hypothetical protein
MSNFEVAGAIVCEDIRQEVTQKFILIGAFGGEINVVALPSVVVLALFLELKPEKAGQFEPEFQVINTDGNIALRARLKIEITDDSSFGMPIGPFPMQVNGPGAVQFQWRFDDGEWEIIRTLKINLKPTALSDLGLSTPTVSLQQTSQSPFASAGSST